MIKNVKLSGLFHHPRFALDNKWIALRTSVLKKSIVLPCAVGSMLTLSKRDCPPSTIRKSFIELYHCLAFSVNYCLLCDFSGVTLATEDDILV